MKWSLVHFISDILYWKQNIWFINVEHLFHSRNIMYCNFKSYILYMIYTYIYVYYITYICMYICIYLYIYICVGVYMCIFAHMGGVSKYDMCTFLRVLSMFACIHMHISAYSCRITCFWTRFWGTECTLIIRNIGLRVLTHFFCEISHFFHEIVSPKIDSVYLTSCDINFS